METFLRSANWFTRKVTLFLLVSMMALSGYAIWDTNQLYVAAQGVQDNIRNFKPEKPQEPDEPADFTELQNINKDIFAWLTVEQTNIDYPLVQGTTNMTYLNKDVYGNYSLAGSIYLDSRNRKNFKDNYSLIYGHHMDKHQMFGDLDLFKDKEFFYDNLGSSVIFTEDNIDYQTLAVFETMDNTIELLNPMLWESSSLRDLAKYIEDHAMFYDNEWVDKIFTHPERYKILALVTCSNGQTGNRTVVLFVTEKPEADIVTPTPTPIIPDSETETDSPTTDGPIMDNPPKTGDTFPMIQLITLTLLSLAVMMMVTLKVRKEGK